MTKLDQSVFQDLDIKINEQIHVNHDKCPAGTDTRKRLYIKKVGTTAYIGHCFNCGLSGYHFGKNTRRAEDLLGRREPQYKKVASTTSTTGSSDFPLHVKEYLAKYYVTHEEAVETLKYRYRKEADGLLMPFWQCKDSGKAYQRRSMSSNSTYRYYTYTHPSITTCSYGYPVPHHNGTLVVVEDQISAYRINRESEGIVDAIALLGTNLTSDVTSLIQLKAPTKLIVWMDYDSAGLKAANDICLTLNPILLKTTMYNVTPVITKQPKEMTPDELREEIKRWMI